MLKPVTRLFLSLLFFVKIATAQTGQVAVPRIEAMPNLPAPYNIRDWKSVAMKFDTFIYDLNKTGQYLPLVAVQNAGVNYPNAPAFSLHTYIGTNSPNGNEGINVLPSLVGASLVGIDKSNQFGKNWLDMSRDFFAKNSGENIYLNNKGGGSGSDWWYDLMPNVYFYQLCDLYPPAPGSIAEGQFLSVADQFLASVRALGGSETPWEKGNFDYRAFNFKTAQPNPSGVHEPEAAGAYAWVLYHAFQKTGNIDYLKGAEQSLEFLSDWQNNPSYELQLPYGTLVAAKMNAEIGTNYDIEKLLNWSFEKGNLRGWGTIVGKWGGLDVSGVVGEANDAGNDYAFQLNGLQQAAALVPMIRYDKRFARAIGKWVLNLTNATRLFYPNFLPANLQDGAAWSAANDPDRVVGYEAMREKFQTASPFSTGDAVGGGWAATNFSVYSTGSIGYLGAIVEKTDADKVLKINVLATDFFKKKAFPTFLYFNPNLVSKSVKIQVGTAPADIYDAISETFLFKNITGEASLTVPADQVLLVTVCPASGLISFEKNKMLVDGTVVDFDQKQLIWEKPPRIQSLAAASKTIEFGEKTALFAKIQTGSSLDLTTEWSATGGNLNAANTSGEWTAPATAGNFTIKIIVTDGNGLKDTAFLELAAVAEINKPPQIFSVEKSVGHVAPGGQIQFTALAADPNGDPLVFDWQFSGGSFSGTGPAVDWTAPNAEGIFDLKIKATDDEGLFAEATTKILVKNFAPTTGNLVAYYKFSENANDLTINQLHGIPFATDYVFDNFGAPMRALFFNGVTSRVTVPVQPVLNFQDGITVSCWLKAADLPAKESFVLSHGSWQNRWKISFTPDQKLRWTVNTLASVGDLDSEISLKKDSFYHVAATYDGQLMALYLNGELHSYRPLSGKIRTANLPFLMGQMLPGMADFNFKGVVDEVKLHDFALVPSAVKTLFDGASMGVFSFPKNENGLRISPNPVGDWLTIESDNVDEVLNLFDVGTAGPLQVFDAGGRLVFSGEKPFKLDVKDWKPGFYVAVFGDHRAVFLKN